MIHVSDNVAHALQNGDPIVALETAVLTSGLPKIPWNKSFSECPSFIDASLPINSALARSMTENVIQQGAIPAWIAIVDGTLRIGLAPSEIDALCSNTLAGKVSLASIAQTMSHTKTAGTTVATTLLACKLASPKKPIRVFATGGIGGFHQHWSERLDVSADLAALATTPTCVVASGAKSILDLHATVEALETIGVPTLGIGTDQFPAFIEQSTESDPHVFRVDSVLEIASICRAHWDTLGLKSSVLASVPAPQRVAIKRGALLDIIEKAESDWVDSHQPSATRTPYVLSALASMTQGKSLLANLELLCNNAKVGGEIATSLANNN